MPTSMITIDEATEAGLRQMAQQRGITPAEMASRLLRRAVRAAQPKVIYDTMALRAYTREHRAEELALAYSDPAHRLELLEAEGRA